MAYIVHRRLRAKTLGGEVNIPYGTIIEQHGDFLYYKEKPLCRIGSEQQLQYIACNNDSQGLLRGKLTQSIISTLRIRTNESIEQHNMRWQPIWNDALCQKYKRPEHEDHWIWNADFYSAPISDLRYIAALMNVKEVI